MATFTFDDLRTLMRSCAGPGEHPEMEGDILDTSYEDLGFDSLAVLELATRSQQDLGIPFPDDAVEEMDTPRHVMEYVSQRRAA
jgi:act minimal PKS acyl carrier protein